MSDPKPSAATLHAKPHFPRILIVALAALALLIVFEVGARCVQPDTLTYTATTADGSVTYPTYHHAHVTITDPQMVAWWYSAINARPLPLDQQNAVLPELVHCNGMQYMGESCRFEFTWHGLPLESATSSETSCGPVLRLNSGGLPSLRAYALPYSLPTQTP